MRGGERVVVWWASFEAEWGLWGYEGGGGGGGGGEGVMCVVWGNVTCKQALGWTREAEK